MLFAIPLFTALRFGYKPGLMKSDVLRQFVSLRETLLREKSSIESRLAAIHEALGVAITPFRESTPLAAPGLTTRRKGKRIMSEEAKARISAAQKKLWAKRRKGKAGNKRANPIPVPSSVAKPRSENVFSLREAVLRVTKDRPLTKQEILTRIEKIGYRTKAKNPMTVLNPLLYGKNPKFKRDNGRFSTA
jgi:hypothetical protein